MACFSRRCGKMFKMDEWSRERFYFTPAIQIFKASLPHVCLVLLNVLYIVAGGFLFVTLESQNEIAVMEKERQKLAEIYDNIANATYSTCFVLSLDEKHFKQHLQKSLQYLSMFHERTPHVLSPHLGQAGTNFTTNWVLEKAMVYALTLITTTGYSEVTSLTKIGMVISVIYGMIGIPLMFLTAADVGKLLSEIVTNCWARCSLQMILRGWCRWCRDLLTEDEPPPQPRMGRRTTMATIRLMGFKQSESRRKQSYLYHNMPIEVPGWLISLLALGYISISGAIFMHYRGWQYVESVHFAFDAMTSITMGITPIDTIAYLLWLMGFCMFGLSVITMCLDLARMKLRNLFIRLHYFGIKLGENLLKSHQLDPEVLLLAEAIREMRSYGFDSVDISALVEYWMKKKEEQANVERMMKKAYKPRDLERIPLIDKKASKTALSPTASLVSMEDLEADFFVNNLGKFGSHRNRRRTTADQYVMQPMNHSKYKDFKDDDNDDDY